VGRPVIRTRASAVAARPARLLAGSGVLGLLAGLLALTGLVLVPAAAAAATPAGWRAAGGQEEIRSYQVTMVLKPNASMMVREEITYDFGTNQRHGITRSIPVEFARDSSHVREYPLSDIEASSPKAPSDLDITEGPVTTLRIGNPDRTVSGVQTYVIRYTVGGVINDFEDHQELYWNAIGSEWSVPIVSASATVEGPAEVQRVACFEGAQGSTQPCTTAGRSPDGGASFSAANLPPGSGMTVVVAFPAGTFPNAAPILRERQTLARAFSVTPATGAASLLILGLVGGGAIAAVARRGRDEEYLGVTPGLEPGMGQTASTSRVPLFRRPPVAVQFSPPEGLLPGQLGTLLDERANVIDVTATIIDLAVRGFMRIEEVSQPGFLHGGDWKLVMTWPAPVDELRDYEMTLLQAIFEDRQEVLLSELRQTFRSDLQRVQGLLYDDVTRNGWFLGNPSSVRARWQIYGFLLTAAGAGLTFLLAHTFRTRFGLVGLAVVVCGVLLLVLSPRMPARTPKGTALLAQAKGFRTYLETAEANQIKFEEGQDIFSRYLPFAIVFGVAERWAKVFADLAASGAAVVAPTWYVGPAWSGGFNYLAFGQSMDSFATTTTGSIAAATPSSSGSSGFGGGGFSGGGGGGGGGGSW
jgi:uncharacterized membrane protein YgcG